MNKRQNCNPVLLLVQDMSRVAARAPVPTGRVFKAPAPIGTGHRDTSSGWASAQRPKNQVRTQPGQRIMGMRARCRKSWRMGGGMQSGQIIREQKTLS